jgi:hypothetical protein
MNGSISGCVTDAVTGEILLSPTLSLTHDDGYAPHYHRLALGEDETVQSLEISLTPGVFIIY